MSVKDNEYITMSLSRSAVRFIEDKILFGELKSGDHLNEYTVAKELNISRAPVREAVRELQMQGILDFIPRKGSTVVELSKADIDEIFDIRILLEKDIIDIILIQRHVTEKDIEVLYEKCREMAKMGEEITEEAKKIYTLNKLDLEFHSYIWNLSHSKRRSAMLRNLFMQLLVFMNNNTKTLGSLEEKAKEHIELVEALKSGDIKRAQYQLDIHINSYRHTLFEQI